MNVLIFQLFHLMDNEKQAFIYLLFLILFILLLGIFFGYSFLGDIP